MARPDLAHRLRTLRRACLVALGATLLVCAPRFASAQAFPNHVIRIVPFGTAGGPIDTIARVYGEKLKARWGQPIVVDAKPGASGIIAADFVAKAPPDGHTVLITLPLTHVNNAILQPEAAVRPGQGLPAAVELATGGPMLIARASTRPTPTVAEFIDYAKAAPAA